MPPKRVAVIGAGPCGLGAVKEFKDEGLDPVCFERTNNIGGLWRYHEDDVDGLASVMKSTIINTSKELGACSNCPPPAHFPNYMHNTLMFEYIRSLAEAGDCMRHIRFSQQTVTIDKAPDYEDTGKWRVTNRNVLTQELTTETFDCVAVCVGHHVFPNFPSFPGQGDFKGDIRHTHSLKSPQGYENLNVVVVGVGNSGMDAAVELSSVAKKVYLSTRRGTWVLPRVGPRGHPFDAAFLRRINGVFQSFLPFDWVCSFVEHNINQIFDHRMYNLKPKHRILSAHPTVSDTLPIKLLSGAVVMRGAIKQFTEKGVIFEDEKEETEVDAVVFATGYLVKFPFLKDDVVRVDKNRVQLYKCMFPFHLRHSTLAILGLIQPNGPGMPVGEMQCRWTAQVFSGQLQLPSQEMMISDIRKREAKIKSIFVDSPRHTFQVDFIEYQDELAEEMGCKPNLWKLAVLDPKLFWAILTGPSLAYQYRLQGPHPWSGARDAILTYEDRVSYPLQFPNKKYTAKRKMLSRGRLMKVFFAIPFIWLLFVIFFK